MIYRNVIRNKRFLQTLKFVNQWQIIPGSFGIGWFFGGAIAAKIDLPETTLDASDVFVISTMLWILLSCLYQFILGFSVDRKLEQIIDSIEQERTKLLSIHNRLDNLRDRLIFEDDNQYWEILEELANNYERFREVN